MASGILDAAQRDWLALSLVPGVGTARFIRLLARFETPGKVLAASEAALEDVVGPKLAQRIASYRQHVDVAGQEQRLAEYGAQFISLDDAAYPPRLAEIYDPPLALFCRGSLLERDQHCVAIVGTRRATAYGLRMAENLGGDLAAKGFTVVSGLAAGIDAAAHRGALEAGGRTAAVLGCGVDIAFPAENAELMHQIIQQGAVLSPFPMGMKALRGNFPQRNRIISGLSLGIVVVEAPPGSGALITARTAAEQGREVFAVPGRAGERNSMGPHALLREGARLAETVQDIVSELPWAEAMPHAVQPPPVEQPPQSAPAQKGAPARTAATPLAAAAPPVQNLSTLEKDVMACLSTDGSFVDEIALACRIPVSEALSCLTMLELKGAVQQYSGKRFAPR